MNSVIITKDTILSLLKEQEDILHKNFYVKRIGLFGSFASDEANEESDIDILVDFEEGNLDYYTIRRDLQDFLSAKFKRQIDVAIRKSLKPFFEATILKQAIYA